MKINKVLIIGLACLALVGCGRKNSSSDVSSSSEPISSNVSSESQSITSNSNSSSSSSSSSSSNSSSSVNLDNAEQEKEFDYIRTVTFDSKGGTSVQSVDVTEGATVSKPNDPTKENNVFKGWYLDGQPYDFASPIYFDITLEAKWEVATNSLTLQKINFSNSLTIDGTKDDGPLTEGCLPSYKVENENPKILVFPVRLSSSYNANTYSSYLEDIEIAFNGTSEETGWESVKTFYQKSSYGKCNLDITVWDEWFYESTITATYLQNLYDNYNSDDDTDPNELLITKILDKYNSQIDYSNYDSNNDEFIDSIWIIYDEPVNFESDESMYWAYTSWDYEWYDESYDDCVNPSKARDGVYPFYYAWAGVDFMYPERNQASYNVDSINLDAHTYIHETGHLLGLDDYYDYNSSSDPDRGLYTADMMDANIGDHGVISKLLLDWVDPYIVTESGEATIGSFTTSGDCIIIADHTLTTIYDTYYIIEFYTNDGLNSNDEPIIDGHGIRITYVHAEVNKVNGEVDWNGGQYDTSFKYDNSDTSIPFVEMLSNNSFETDMYGDKYASASNLFTQGQTYNTSLFSLQVVSISSSEAVVNITLN